MLSYSLIVCTYNRADFLKETIESILSKFSNKKNYELLIIDNNSSDHTTEVVRLFADVPVLRYVLEKEQGLSHARNKGIKEARHDILVFLDDDIDIDKDYLDVCDLLYKDPANNIIGGKVLPYQVQIPDWLPPKFHYIASVFDLGDKPHHSNKLMGANHTFRKEVAAKVGFYNISLGPIGSFKMGGDENEFLQRAQSLGYKILYHPDLVVYHKIENRLNEEFIYHYAANIGTSEAHIDAKENKTKFLLKGIKSGLMVSVYFLYGAYTQNHKQRVSFRIKKSQGMGYLKKLFG